MQNQKCPKCGGEMDAGKVVAESLMYYSDHQKKRFKLGILVDKATACLTCGYIELYLNAETLNKKIQDNNPDGMRQLRCFEIKVLQYVAYGYQAVRSKIP